MRPFKYKISEKDLAHSFSGFSNVNYLIIFFVLITHVDMFHVHVC